MNRNVLKWVLIAAVIIGAAAYFILSEMPSGQRQGKQGKEKIVVGNSKAFEIEPIEGITISAVEDALDKDRKITLTPISDEKYNEVCEAFSEQGITPLFVFDYHAGLKPDESFPGDVNFDVDLDLLGIPRNLQDRVCVYRYTSGENGGSYRYLTQNQKGHIRFSGNQNSYLLFAFNPLLYHAVNMTAAKTTLSTIWEIADAEFQHVPASAYFAASLSTISIPIPDKHGDFILTFRFSDTENPDGYKAFAALGDKMAALEEKAKNQFEDTVKAEVKKEQEGYSIWQKIFSKKQVQAIRESINYEEILEKLVNEDPVLKAYHEDPVSQLPKSVQAFVGYVKQANKYLDDKGVHPLDREFYVYLVTNTVLGADNFGVANKVPFGKCYLLLNYDKYNGDSENPSVNQSRREGVLLTSVHELFHNRQKLYYCTFSMNSCAAEATAVAMEWDAARDFYRDGVITTDPSTFDGQDNLSLTKRKEFQIFNVPFDKITKKASGVDVGYTLSLPIEDIRKNAGKEDKVSMAAFVRNYSVYGPHTIGWTGWLKKSLEINDDELDKGWLYFGEKNMKDIVSKQATIMDKTPGDVFASKIIKPTLEQPIVHLKELAKAQDYTVHSYEIDLPTNGLPGKRNITEFARVFIINKSKENNPCVSFYFDSNNRFNGISPVKPALTFDYLRTGVYTLGVITTSMSRSKIPADQYYVVALFTPEEPKITRVKESTLQFKMPSPSSKLTKEKLVTGAVVTLTFPDGTTITKDVAPKYFGNAVKWKNLPGISEKDFKMSLHWYYQTDENAVYDSPESKEVEWKGKPGKKKEEPKPVKIDEKKGYWKQVNLHYDINAVKVDMSKIDDAGFATHDLRGFEMKKVEGENEVEFTGTACTKIKENGKTLFQPETYLDGYVSFTEPPKQWPANTNYTCEWYTEQDPFVKKMDKPFTFKVENTTSAPKACEKGKDKVTEKKSKTANAKWIHQVKTVYKTKKPGKNDPKEFTIEQKYTINGGSGLNAIAYLTYYYEWVDGEPEEEVKEEDLGNLGIGIEFPMNARDKAYFGEHGGSLLHRNDFGVIIPSGSYSVKKSGKGYILEGSGHHEGSRPRASHSIEVRIELDKNKIPVEASFSCQGFYEGTGRTMKTETTTFQATGTAKLTEKELGPNSRRGKCTSFNGIIHTESEGDFDYSNTEGGHLTIRWKCD